MSKRQNVLLLQKKKSKLLLMEPKPGGDKEDVTQRPEHTGQRWSALHTPDDPPFFLFLTFFLYLFCVGSLCSLSGSMWVQQCYIAVLHLHLRWYYSLRKELSIYCVSLFLWALSPLHWPFDNWTIFITQCTGHIEVCAVHLNQLVDGMHALQQTWPSTSSATGNPPRTSSATWPPSSGSSHRLEGNLCKKIKWPKKHFQVAKIFLWNDFSQVFGG